MKQLGVFVLFTTMFLFSGCTLVELVKISSSDDDNADYYIDPDLFKQASKPFPKFKMPIARELKIFYLHRSGFNNKSYKPTIYTNEENIVKNGKITLPAFSKVDAYRRSNDSQSERLTQQAREASKRGNHKHAEQLHSGAISAKRMEIAFSKMSSSVNLLSSSLSFALDKSIQGSNRAHAKIVIDFIENELNIIGDKAPKDSVLHLYFHQDTMLAISPTRVKNTEHIVATLVDGDRIIYSSIEQLWFMIDGKPSGEWFPPRDYQIYGRKSMKPIPSGVNTEILFRKKRLAAAMQELYRQNTLQKAN